MPLTLQSGYMPAYMGMGPMGGNFAQAPAGYGTEFMAGDFMGTMTNMGNMGNMGNALPMAGVRPYTGQFAPDMQQRGMQQQYQIQQMQMRAGPPPRAVEIPQQQVLQQQPSPSKSLRRENEQLRQQLEEAFTQIENLSNDLRILNAENQALRQHLTTPSPAPAPATNVPVPVSQNMNTSVEENLREVPNSSSIRASTSRTSTAAYGRPSTTASRSNNSLSQSRSGTLTSQRPAWKGSGAHSAPLSFGATVRQLYGPAGTLTLAVTRVAQNGPAAGILREGDILEECEFVAPKEKDAENKQRLRRLAGCGFSKSALQKTLNTFNSGDSVTFSVNRNGERFESKITLTPAELVVTECATPERNTPVDSSLLDPSGDDDSFGPRIQEQEVADINTSISSNQLSDEDLSKLQNMNFEALLTFCINEATRHFGDEVASDETAMAILTQAVRACESQLKSEGSGDVRAKALWQNKDLILHITGQQCFENGFVQEPISMAF